MLSIRSSLARPKHQPQQQQQPNSHFSRAANLQTVMMEEAAFTTPVSSMEPVRLQDEERNDKDNDERTFYHYQHQQPWPDRCSNNKSNNNNIDESCYVQRYHDQLWDRSANESSTAARREGYINSVARAMDHEQQPSMFDMMQGDDVDDDDFHQHLNVADDLDVLDVNHNHVMMQPVPDALEQQHVANGPCQYRANPSLYGRWHPTESKRLPSHFVRHAKPHGHYYYYRPVEAPSHSHPCPMQSCNSEFERSFETLDDCDAFPPCSTSWTMPHGPAGDNFNMDYAGKSLSADEMPREPSMAPIAKVVSSDTQDRHGSFPDHASPPFMVRRQPTQAGQVVQTPEGPALLLLAANIPSPAARPYSVLHRTAPSRANATATTTVAAPSPKRRFQRWTDEEDSLLRDACSMEPGPPFNWIKIAGHYFKNERSPTQCKSRWGKALQPGIHRGKWQPEEDALVIQMKQEGRSFAEIAKHVEGRTAEHIRERWISTLDPSNRYDPWTEEEVKVLFEAQSRLGNKWSEIAKLLPGRSEIAVKNRYHNAKTSERRKVRRFAAEMMRADRLERARQQHKVVVPSPALMSAGISRSLSTKVSDETLKPSAVQS